MIEIINFNTTEEENFPLIFLPINNVGGDSYNKALAQSALTSILLAFRCRQCRVYQDAQLPDSSIVDGPHIGAQYPSHDDPNQLLVRFSCPKSRSSGKKNCWSPHNLQIKEVSNINA